MKTIDDQEIKKFSQHANDWWDENGPLKTLHDINPLRLSFIEKYLDLKGKRILDLGCGGGILSEALAKAGALVVGIDAAFDAINVAKNHAEKEGLIIDYQSLPIEEFEGEPFDSIVCMEMLEHVQNPRLVLQHCARLLRPQGKLFLSTINRTVKAYATAIVAAEYILKLLPRQTHDFDKFIKPSELAAILRTLNIDITALKGMEYNPFSGETTLTSDVSINYLLACQAV